MSHKAPIGKISISRGTLRGRNVKFREQEDLRPTPSRVREAVFSMLSDEAETHGFLDACSGSGVMGFSAFSCGFKPVVMVETNAVAQEQIEANRRALGADVTLHCTNVLQVHKMSLSAGLWVCYADPPFKEQKFHGKLMTRLAELEAFQPGSLYVAEHEVPFKGPDSYEVVKAKRYGRSMITVFQKLASAPVEDETT